MATEAEVKADERFSVVTDVGGGDERRCWDSQITDKVDGLPCIAQSAFWIFHVFLSSHDC